MKEDNIGLGIGAKRGYSGRDVRGDFEKVKMCWNGKERFGVFFFCRNW